MKKRKTWRRTFADQNDKIKQVETSVIIELLRVNHHPRTLVFLWIEISSRRLNKKKKKTEEPHVHRFIKKNDKDLSEIIDRYDHSTWC